MRQGATGRAIRAAAREWGDGAALNKMSAVGATVVSGASNVLLQLVAAHFLSATNFARFVVGTATIFLVLGLARSSIGETDLIRGRRERDEESVAAAFVFAGAAGIVGLTTALASRLVWHDMLFPLGMALLLSPFFVLQDCARFRAFRTKQAPWALASDFVVFALCLVAFVGIGDKASAMVFLTIWGAATAVGWVMLIRPLGYWGRPNAAPAWWRNNRDIVVPGGWEYILQSGAVYVLYWVVLFLGGAVALAGYRIVQLVFAGLGNFAQGVNAFELPQLSANPSGKVIRSLLLRNAAILTIPAICLYLTIDRMPERAGIAIFGESWLDAPSFLLAGAAHGTINALLVANFQVLRILGEARYSLLVRLVSVLLTPIVCLLAGKAYGAVGVAWGLALVAAFSYAARLVRTIERTREPQVV